MKVSLHFKWLEKLIFLLLISSLSTTKAQTVVSAWTFDSGVATTVVSNFGAEPAILYADGTNGSSSWSGLESFGGSTINDPRSQTNASNSFSVVGGSPSNNGKGIVFRVPMSGYENPLLSYATRGTSSGFSSQTWSYSTNGATFTTMGQVTGTTSTSYSAKNQSTHAFLDLSAIDVVDNVPFIYLRVVFAGSSNATGNNRIDNVVVRASALPDATPPTVISNAATGITPTSAVLNATINANGTATNASFLFGTTSNPGTTLAGTPLEITGTGNTEVSASPGALLVNTRYYFRAVGTSETVVNGNVLNFYTLANTPNPSDVSNPSTSTLDVEISSNGNPAQTQFAIQETAGQYVQGNGSLGSTAVWQTADAWSVITVTGLNAATTYTFRVKARNGDLVETGFSGPVSGTTVGMFEPIVTVVAPLPPFGSICVNTQAIQSFTIDATNLDGSNITIGSLQGFSYSLSE
ncbi:MAG: hypothetical protein EOP49_37030, partial [Sphingobacteriales bacterium]